MTVSDTPALTLPPPFIPPPPPTPDLSAAELKTLLLFGLLDETSVPTDEGIDLITMLFYHIEPPPPPQTPYTTALLATLA